MITLTHQNWTLEVQPELGASLNRLSWRDHQILRPETASANSPLETGSFPLLPYANRIANGAFAFNDRQIVLPPTLGFEPHALHGLGWQRPWSVLRYGDAFVELGLASQACPDWPWDWSASHRLELGVDLAISLSITNESRGPMPAGLGLHPYFMTVPGTILTVPADEVWTTDGSLIPDRLSPPEEVFDWRQGAKVAGAPFVDNAYCSWSGQARLDHPDHTVKVAASSKARWVHIYAPGSGGFVCIEPVTHRPNAHNAPPGEDSGLVILNPGQTLSMSMQISVAVRNPSGEV
ncbi:MAG: aldose 1-epimerase [Alphaproteobacteria bacterium]|nr:MAG: aldose 1-epimerase [Alphaproteobacteria bacterium]PZO37987.1 MAG: aldose 1-epimerase [Alphaproteobacteria bacterium]